LQGAGCGAEPLLQVCGALQHQSIRDIYRSANLHGTSSGDVWACTTMMDAASQPAACSSSHTAMMSKAQPEMHTSASSSCECPWQQVHQVSLHACISLLPHQVGGHAQQRLQCICGQADSHLSTAAGLLHDARRLCKLDDVICSGSQRGTFRMLGLAGPVAASRKVAR
jgi:hypothetical protein